MSLHSTHENRHSVEVSTSLGGVEAEISKHQKNRKNSMFWGIDISASTPPVKLKLLQDVYFHECYAMTLSFIQRGGTV